MWRVYIAIFKSNTLTNTIHIYSLCKDISLDKTQNNFSLELDLLESQITGKTNVYVAVCMRV